MEEAAERRHAGSRADHHDGRVAIVGQVEVLVALHEYRHLATAGAVGDDGGGDALALAVAHGGNGEMDFLWMRLGAGGDGVKPWLQTLEGAQQFTGRAVDRKLLQHVRQLPTP
ncbi:hypothetical protein D9M73_263980 [compost metagenome]